VGLAPSWPTREVAIKVRDGGVKLDDARQRFKMVRLAVKEKHGPQALAAAYREMNKRKEP
jgi:hypothetical protein